MTLTEALHRLHRAGKIRSPWLPGMKLVGAYADYPARVHAFGERPFDTEDVVAEEPLRWWVEPETRDGGPYKGPYLPDLTDPATVGCLAALAREATGNPTLMVDCDDARSKARGAPVWHAFSWRAGTPDYPRFDTEGEAWASVLIRAAEALPPPE